MSFKKDLRKMFLESSIWLISGSLILISILIPITFGLLTRLFPLFSSDFQLIGIIIMNLLLAFNGYVQIYRRESPGFGFGHTIKGTIAVINGVILCLFFLGLNFFIIILRLFFNERLY